MTNFDLEDLIKNKMRMSHIYQPVILKVLLENDGQALVEQPLLPWSEDKHQHT